MINVFFSLTKHKKGDLSSGSITYRVHSQVLNDAFSVYFSIIAKHPIMSAYCSSFREQADWLTQTGRDGSPKTQTQRTNTNACKRVFGTYMIWSPPPFSLCLTVLQLDGPVSVPHMCWAVPTAITCPVCLECWCFLLLVPQVIPLSVQQGSLCSLSNPLYPAA